MLFLKQIRKMQQEQTNQEGVANIVAFDNSNDRLQILISNRAQINTEYAMKNNSVYKHCTIL